MNQTDTETVHQHSWAFSKLSYLVFCGFLLLIIMAHFTVTLMYQWDSVPYRADDSAYYYAQADHLFRGEGAVSRNAHAHHVIHDEIEHKAFSYWQPGTSVVAAAGAWVLGDLDRGASMSLFLICTIGVSLSLIFLCRWFSAPWVWGLLICVIYLSLHRVYLFRNTLESPLIAALPLLWAVAFYAKSQIKEKWHWRLGFIFISGFLIGLSAMTRGSAIAIGGLFLLIAPLILYRLQAWRYLWIGILGMGLAYLPLAVYYKINFGAWTSPSGRYALLTTVSYHEFYHFPAVQTFANKTMMQLFQARIDGVWSAWYAMQRPSIMFCITLVVIGLLLYKQIDAIRNKSAKEETTQSRDQMHDQVKLNGIQCSALLFIIIIGVFITMAPAVVHWNMRAMIMHWPVLLLGFGLAMSLFHQLGLSTKVRLIMYALLSGLVITQIILNPFHLLSQPPQRPNPLYADALAEVDDGTIVMTNAPLPTYVVHRSGVVMVPHNGAQAISACIEHYKPGVLVLFGVKRSTDPREHTDKVIEDIYASSSYDLPNGYSLELLKADTRYRVYVIHHHAKDD